MISFGPSATSVCPSGLGTIFPPLVWRHNRHVFRNSSILARRPLLEQYLWIILVVLATPRCPACPQCATIIIRLSNSGLSSGIHITPRWRIVSSVLDFSKSSRVEISIELSFCCSRISSLVGKENSFPSSRGRSRSVLIEQIAGSGGLRQRGD